MQTTEAVPSANLRQGTVSYYASDGSIVNLQPSDIANLDQGCLTSGTCPNGNGVSQAVLDLWNGKDRLPNGTPIPAYPLPNTVTSFGSDGLNILGYTFAAPQPTNLNTYLLKLDYNLTQNGNHRLFLRGDLQNDRTLAAPQFPGEPPSHILRNNSKGLFAGYTAVLSNTVINNFRYGFVRQGNEDAGSNPNSYVGFWNLSDQVSFASTTNVNVPVNQFVDDASWTRGQHTLQFGGNWRIVDDNRCSNAQNFFYGSLHPTWLFEGGIAGTGQDLDPANNPVLPPMDVTDFGYS